MRRNHSPFKWRHYEPEIILLCVRWYCRYSLSYRELADTDARARPFRSPLNFIRVGSDTRQKFTKESARI